MELLIPPEFRVAESDGLEGIVCIGNGSKAAAEEALGGSGVEYLESKREGEQRRNLLGVQILIRE